MLLAIRDRATGWIAWIIVILLIIPFALWGIQEYVGGGSEPIVAEVNGVEITRNQLSEQTQRLMRNLQERPEGEELSAFRQRVLESMISEQVLVDAAQDQGMRIPAAQVEASVRAIPAFQADGQFSQQAYLRALANVRLSPEAFWAQQRRELLREQLLRGVGETALATDHDIDEFIRLRNRKLELSYGILKVEDFVDEVQVSAEEIQSHYQEHADRYTTPPRVKLAYLMLDMAEIEASIPVTEEQLRAMFEERRSGLFQPEKRSVAHILIAVPGGADPSEVDAARERAEAIRARIEAGEDFATLAREHSDDPASAQQGGDLGVLEPGTRDVDFELAAAELAQGEVSQPVRTPDGFEIIKLTEHTPARRPSFDEAREQLAEEYRHQEAETLFYDRSETLLDLSYENPLSLEVAAEALGLEIQHTDWITPDGADSGIGSDPEVVNAAFSEEVLGDGKPENAVNSRLIELQGDDERRVNPVVVIRPAEYEPSRLRPLEQVEADIRATLQRQKAGALAQSKAQELEEALAAGGSFETVVGPVAGSLEQGASVGRDDSNHPPELVEAAFSLGMPAAEKPLYGTAALGSGDVAVLAVTGASEGDAAALSEQEREAVRRLVQRMQGLSEAQSLIEAVRERAEISINERALAREQN